MREILFRGKNKENGDWVFGSYIQHEQAIEYPVDISPDGQTLFCEGANVIESTVGQFTGLTDKNSKKIFEGDIVCIRFSDGCICSIGDIQYDCGVFGAEWVAQKKGRTIVGDFGQLHNLRRLDDDIINHIEVVGNIHDNPELLENAE